MSSPNHVAIIMDGNGRWAQQRNLPRFHGHISGVNVVSEIIQEAIKNNISILTLYALSKENYNRPVAEVNFLLKLFSDSINNKMEMVKRDNIKIQFIGDILSLPKKLQESIRKIEALTQDNSRLHLNIALNYSGKWHIAQAVRQLLLNNAKSNIHMKNDDIIDNLDDTINNDLGSSPDILIRTGFEQRISNFALWSIAYTELYFADCFWPDFSKEHFFNALKWYKTRVRKYGLIKEGT